MKKFTYLIATGIIVIFTSCGGGGSSSNVEEPTPDTENAATFVDVNQIISANCLNCHGTSPSQGAPMSLTTYSQISFFATSIADRINKSDTSSLLMPLNGPKLSSSDIAKIESWIAAGKPNN